MRKRIVSGILAVVILVGMLAVGAPRAKAESQMRTSAECIAVIKQFEGFHAKPYWDYKQWTFGYGTRCPDDKVEYYKQNGISEAEAEALLVSHLQGVEESINGFLDSMGITFTQGQFDAMVSLSFNCGVSWIKETGGILHNAIVSGATGNDFLRPIGLWSTAGGEVMAGLIRRRLSEANMYLNGVYDATPPENFAYVLLDANGGSIRYRVQAYDTGSPAEICEKPTYGSYQFAGWFLDPVGGEQVTQLDAAVKGKILYAHWKDAAGNEVIPDALMGTVNVSSSLNIRKEPSTASEKVGSLQNGDSVKILQTKFVGDTVWGQTSAGWISLSYVRFDTDGWAMLNVERYYIRSGVLLTGWQFIGNAWFYLSSSGAMQTGWQFIDNAWYYLDGSGAMQTGWQFIDNAWYYLNDSGAMQTGWQQIDGLRYYFNGSGALMTGWFEESGNRYYQDVNEGIATGTKVIDGKTYQFSAEGILQEDEEETAPAISGKVSVETSLNIRKEPSAASEKLGSLKKDDNVKVMEIKFAEGTIWGRISAGWISLSYVRFDTDGWAELNGERYYIRSGVLQTGWLFIGGAWYYLNSSGVMQTGWQFVGSAWYYLNDSGAMQTGWLPWGSVWYYLKDNGVMASGETLNIGGTYYSFDASGVWIIPSAKDGWEWENGTWYYYQGGAKQTGWQFIGNAWYYLNSSGAMQTGWQFIGNAWYYLNDSGAMHTGWLDLGGVWYYLNASGAMQTGWQCINGTWYFLNDSGVWIY